MGIPHFLLITQQTKKKWLKILFKFDNKNSDSFCVIYDWIFEGNLNAVGEYLYMDEEIKIT